MENKISFMQEQDGRTTYMQISAESTLDEVVSTFEDFLRGCGFHFEESLEFVNEHHSRRV